MWSTLAPGVPWRALSREPGEVLDKVDTGFSVCYGSDFRMCHLGACRTPRCRRGLWGDCTMDGLTHLFPAQFWLWGEASCAAQPEALLWPCASLGRGAGQRAP